jgi:hypothetical protein
LLGFLRFLFCGAERFLICGPDWLCDLGLRQSGVPLARRRFDAGLKKVLKSASPSKKAYLSG